MKKLFKIILDNRDKIAMALLVTLVYLIVIIISYALIEYNIDGNTLIFIFSRLIYGVETMFYLLCLIAIFGGGFIDG